MFKSSYIKLIDPKIIDKLANLPSSFGIAFPKFSSFAQPTLFLSLYGLPSQFLYAFSDFGRVHFSRRKQKFTMAHTSWGEAHEQAVGYCSLLSPNRWVETRIHPPTAPLGWAGPDRTPFSIQEEDVTWSIWDRVPGGRVMGFSCVGHAGAGPSVSNAPPCFPLWLVSREWV